MQTKYLSVFLSVLLVSGCQSSFGPSALNNTHIPYNQAISDTLNQQMLLNLVRLKYRDEAYYLTVGSVTSSLNFSGNAGINSQIDLGPAGNSISPSLGFAYSDSPTISYLPLQGENFFKSVFTELPIATISILGATGWNMDDIFGLCVEEINGVENAARASGLTPKLAPHYREFEKIQLLLRKLQMTRSLRIGMSGKLQNVMLMKFIQTAENKPILSELMTLLGLPTTTRLVKVSDVEFLDMEKPKDTVTIYTRSMSSMLFYLSHNIQVPQEHIDQGLVPVTKTAEGNLFDWSQTPAGKLLTIKSSKNRPDNAFLATFYRDYWYYIADDDLKSKSTFMLITQLFDYQAGHSESASPVLTIPVK